MCLRLYVSAADYRNEISASDEIFKRTADAYRRIRNTARFLLANLAGFDPVTDCLPVEQLLPLDRWILGQAQALQAEVRTAYDDYQFHLVYHRIHNFCSGELGGFYLDIIKDRQYTTGTDSLPRRSAQTSLFHLAEALCRWIAPILSFTAEELWENLPGPDRLRSFSLSGMRRCPIRAQTTIWIRPFGRRWWSCGNRLTKRSSSPESRARSAAHSMLTWRYMPAQNWRRDCAVWERSCALC
jgi:isoleucyl-tRNA synthetase